MKIYVKKRNFLKFLDNNFRIVDHGNTNMSMRAIYFDVLSDKIIATTTNNEMSIQNIMDLDNIKNRSEGTGSFLVLAKNLKAILNYCDEDIALTIKNNSLNITSGSYVTDISLLETESFQEINFVLQSNKFDFESELLINAIKKVGYIAMNHPAKEDLILSSLNLNYANGKLEIISTDKKRIAMETRSINYIEEFNISLHSKTIRYLQSLSFEKTIEIYPGSYELKIKNGREIIKTKIVNLPYQDLSTNNPFKWEMDIRIEIEKQHLINLIDKVTVLNDSKNNIVKFKIENRENQQSLGLSSYISEGGKFEVKTESVKIHGESFTVNYNAQFLKEALNVFNGDIDLFINKARGALLIVSAEYQENRQLIASVKGY
ncbi:hypothetical protein CJJ23_03250 [Mycoplasmopsis agassizii]|uniref:Uncharacterized protein n=1 Tax=Mycoplasmopsis agassizii TaxID=33922 RepID=A0A269TIH0_9BACT|nr:hypothetical protein [Mycoplasmopsis agassizii]PAK21201.1 hypothetical protein CJJ23_03250 [Mycoplasmopsis agassizii]